MEQKSPNLNKGTEEIKSDRTVEELEVMLNPILLEIAKFRIRISSLSKKEKDRLDYLVGQKIRIIKEIGRLKENKE